MPIHVHPRLRAREEAEEAAGLIVTLDSAGVICQKALEASGATPKVVPVGVTYFFNGKALTAK